MQNYLNSSTYLVHVVAVKTEPADVYVLDGLLLLALLERGVDGGEEVEEVGALLRRVELERRRVVLRGHHEEAGQRHLVRRKM